MAVSAKAPNSAWDDGRHTVEHENAGGFVVIVVGHEGLLSMNERSQPLRTMASAGELPDAGWHWAGEREGHGPGEAHVPSWGRVNAVMKVCRGPAHQPLVQQQVGDHLATRQIEAVGPTTR